MPAMGEPNPKPFKMVEEQVFSKKPNGRHTREYADKVCLGQKRLSAISCSFGTCAGNGVHDNLSKPEFACDVTDRLLGMKNEASLLS